MKQKWQSAYQKKSCGTRPTHTPENDGKEEGLRNYENVSPAKQELFPTYRQAAHNTKTLGLFMVIRSDKNNR